MSRIDSNPRRIDGLDIATWAAGLVVILLLTGFGLLAMGVWQ